MPSVKQHVLREVGSHDLYVDWLTLAFVNCQVVEQLPANTTLFTPRQSTFTAIATMSPMVTDV